MTSSYLRSLVQGVLRPAPALRSAHAQRDALEHAYARDVDAPRDEFVASRRTTAKDEHAWASQRTASDEDADAVGGARVAIARVVAEKTAAPSAGANESLDDSGAPVASAYIKANAAAASSSERPSASAGAVGSIEFMHSSVGPTRAKIVAPRAPTPTSGFKAKAALHEAPSDETTGYAEPLRPSRARADTSWREEGNETAIRGARARASRIEAPQESSVPAEVHIHIGRIELSALGANRPLRRDAPKGKSPLSLDEYLRNRDASTRRQGP